VNAARRATWAVGAPVRAVLIGIIRAYRLTLSGWLGGQCRFAPTCSHYAEHAIRGRGWVRGIGLASWRVLRCNPFGAGGWDPAPAGSEYEDIILSTGLGSNSSGGASR
jgi:putative membrane protein insertion efficiency factor